jgi:hypothetical protein
MLNAVGIWPLVSIKEIDLDQSKSPFDCVYHLLVNSFFTMFESVELGSITTSVLP